MSIKDILDEFREGDTEDNDFEKEIEEVMKEPPLDVKIESIRDKEKSLKEDISRIDEINEKLDDVSSSISKLNESFEEVKKNIVSEEDLKKAVEKSSLKEEIESMREELNNQESTFPKEDLAQRFDELQQRENQLKGVLKEIKENLTSSEDIKKTFENSSLKEEIHSVLDEHREVKESISNMERLTDKSSGHSSEEESAQFFDDEKNIEKDEEGQVEIGLEHDKAESKAKETPIKDTEGGTQKDSGHVDQEDFLELVEDGKDSIDESFKSGKDSQDEIPREISSWIESNLERGFSPMELKKSLKKSNYDPEIVEVYMNRRD